MKKQNFFLSLSRRCCSLRALLPAVILLGMTPLLSQVSAQQSSSSEEHLLTWTQLSGKFEQSLNQHERTLTELSEKLSTSEANGRKLTGLSDELLKQNDDLKNYNDQIGERMQERDEDLAAAYDNIDKLEKKNLKSLIVIIVMGALITGAVVFKVLRLLKAIPI